MAQRKETASAEAKRGLTRRDALKGAAVAGLGILGAVSYTHLDVDKRQVV